MRRAHLLAAILVPLLSALAGCQKAPDFWAGARPGQKRILVTFPPLYSITTAVAGDKAYVLCLLTTTGPHDYDGAATDLLKINKADLLICNGLTLDDAFTANMLKNHRNKSLEVLNVGETIETKYPSVLHQGGHEHHDDAKKDDKHDHKEDKHAHAKAEDHPGHQHGKHDPHLWLGPDQAGAMAKVIAGKLAEIDPGNKKVYDDRAKDFIDELEKIEAYGKAAFKDKKNKKIITMHEAFDYFADAFGIDIVATIQKRPGADPDAKWTANLIDLCKKHEVRVIAVEPQYSRNQATALQADLKQKGLDVRVITLDPLETAAAATGKVNPDAGYYLKGLKENIDTLAKALP